ncbi:hypothetical protein FNF29_02205 [Cafeteria roenbergensis]|uniref:Uncharacterized protein n=1 Tax=Cafeteria roenbergensis TaxID=33653 RepID=A0A5A8CNP7_CAFRO|nr:hypothetical protein FNF29_02205 [Cafeteria roenbergensis]|eukprot:KAA0154675.1 hypothetical protein FNF29_02205 [Cafeteria roenbergensis]
METAAKRRQDANELFRAGKHAEAAEAYGSAIAALAPVEASGAGGDAAVAVRTERATLLSNRAACHIRLGKFDAAIEDTTDALEIDGALVKARYRRAQAFHGKGRGMRAVMDLQEVLSVDPGNAGAKALLAKLLDEGKRGAAKQPAAVEAAEGLVAALKGSGAPGASAGPGGSGPAAAAGSAAGDASAASVGPKLRTLGPTDAARRAAGDSKPAGVAPDAQLDVLVGHMAKGLQGRGALAAASALAGRDGPVNVAEALASAGRLAPLPLLAALRQVGVHAGAAGVASLTRAVARHPGAFWPAAAHGGSAGPFADKEVPDEAGRLMALAEVAAGAQEPRLAALSLCSEEDLARASGSRAVQLVSRICGALQAGSATADVRGAVGTALAAIAHTLGRSSGLRAAAAPAAASGVGSGPGGPTRVERLSAEEAAVHCAGRVVRTRAAADVAVALGLPRRLAAVASDSPPRLRRAAEGALARVVERAMQPPDALPPALEAVAGSAGSAAASAAIASASAVVEALREWRRKRRLYREPTRMASVIRPIVSDVVDAEAESRRAEAEAEAEADAKASSRRAMRQLAARRRKETRRQRKAAAAAAAAETGAGEGAGKSGSDEEDEEEEEEEEEGEGPTREEAEAEAASLARERARKEEEEAAAVKARACPVTARHRAAVGLATAFLVDRDAALQAVRWRGLLPAVVSLATAPSGPAQAACAEVLSHMAADADGREAIGESGWTALRVLSEEGSPAVQATALVTLSRAMASAKATAAASLAGRAGEESPEDRAAATAMGLTRGAGSSGQTASSAAPQAASGAAAASAGGAASGAGGSADGLAAAVGAESLTTEERGMLESFAAASRSLVLGVGPCAEAWAAKARAGPGETPMSLGGAARGPGSSEDATGTVTLAADEAGMFAITVRAPPREEGPKGLGRGSTAGTAGGAAAAGGGPAGHLPAASVISSSARSVEALAVLCTRTVCKRALAADKPTLTALLAVAGALAAEASAAYKSGSGIVSAEWGPAALGVCYCIYALCVSEQERRERALAERDVTPRQWQEFQKLTMGGGGEDPEADPSADVDKRMEALLDAGALGALHRLADAASLSWRAARAALTGGAASSGEGPAMGGGDGTWRADVVGPLLLLTHSPSGLQCFEAALALTNVSSHGAEEAQRVVAMGGLAALEDVQFCDHPRLRRAGTEALTNLAVTPRGAGLITGERLGLWLALARGYGDDVETSVAAAGGLAMAMAMDDGDPMGPDDPSAGGRARVLAHPKGISSLCCAVASGHQPLQHRALAALQMLADVVVPASDDHGSGKPLAGWEELTRPREIGNEDEGESQDGGAPESESGSGDALPQAVRRQAADAVAAAAAAGAPSASGVKVSAVHLALLLSQGQAMADLTAAEDGEDEDDGSGEAGRAAAGAPELQPAVREAAIALLADIRRAATAAGVELAF